MEKLTTKIYDYLPDEALRLREEVFLGEQGFTVERDDIDDIAYHVTFDLDGVVVATCRVFYDDSWTVGRIAVKKGMRGKGLGKALLLEAEKIAREKGGENLKLHAQVRAVHFYEKCGYKSYGNVGYEEWCEHIWMKKDLKNSQK